MRLRVAAGLAAVVLGCCPAFVTAALAADVPVQVRVRGLALGSQLELRQGASSLIATLNDQYTFAQPAQAGAPLDIAVLAQPAGQVCAVSELAPATVPADSAPVFVRCRSLSGPRVPMPASLPEQPLSLMFGAAALRPTAYPGVPYESRPGVLGGRFPYEFRITGYSVDGVSRPAAALQIDFRHGTVRFTPQQEGSHVIGLEVRDSAAVPQVLAQNLTVQVSRAAFVFVATDGVDAPDRGAIDSPYRSLAYALARTTPEQAVMLRKGRHVTGGFGVFDARARQFLAYPDEVVTLDLDYQSWVRVSLDQFPVARFEDLDFTQVRQYGIFSDPTRSGLVVRNVRFLDGREGGLPDNENPAFIHGYGDNTRPARHRLLVQDNDFGPLQMTSAGAYALTLFDAGDSLLENNQIRVGATSGGIHDKDNSQRNTYRENYIAFDTPNPHGIHVSAQDGSQDIHIHHNLLINAGVRLGLQCTSASCAMRNHDVHHNTLTGVRLGWGVFNSGSSGTRISHNILYSGSGAPYSWHSCLGAVPANLASLFSATHNLIETTATLALRDTECGGGPMNISWASWRDTYAMDTAAAGSVVTAASSLSGAGPLLGLPASDARRPLYGHLYLGPGAGDVLFQDGFQPLQ